MDSALDSALDPPHAEARSAGWRQRLRAAISWLGWTGPQATRGRKRRMQLDRVRVAAAVVATVCISAATAVAWTRHAANNATAHGAAVALAALEERLDDMVPELRRFAALTDSEGPLTACSPALVQALLEASLQSPLLRRFEVVEQGNSLRCGPQGPAWADARADARVVAPGQGLSLVLGRHIAARPALSLDLGQGAAVQASLDGRVLALPDNLWAADFDATALHIVVLSADGGRLPLWGAGRGAPVDEAPWLQVQARSVSHQVTVVSQLGRPAFVAMAARAAAWAALLGLLLALAAVAWTWRRAVLRTRLVHRLARALRKRQFVPFVQPIVDLQTGRCRGGEVLMRWNHPQRGIVPPGEFIEEAERTGLIIGMSDLTMSLAAHRLAALAQADPSLYFSFNVTPGQLREPGFAQRLAAIFGPDTVPRQQVLLEVTERDFVDVRAKGMLVALHADGWRIAIDDFGTGQSSLATIEELPIERIKIDRSFVSSIDEKTVSRPVLDAIVQLARELHIPLIAEGVETRSQWDYLAARGVASAQGYLMAKPMPVTAYQEWLQQQQDTAPASAEPTPRTPRTAAAPRSLAQQQLWQRMRAPGGLHIADRTHLLRSYPRCFIGREAVDWLVANQGVGRREALRLGRSLVAVGLIHHVLEEHDFEDGDFFYRLASDTASAKSDALPDAAAGRKALQLALDFPWRSHSRGLLRHHQCATGRVVVDWIVRRHDIPRATAVHWATHWMRQGALRHVFDTQAFEDDNRFLYRLG